MKKNYKFKYKEIADNLTEKILKGVYKVDESLPPVRKISKDLNVSISSIIQAYILLEKEGLIKAKPQSGYYVLPITNRQVLEPEQKTFSPASNHYYGEELVTEVNDEAIMPDMTPLGAGIPFIGNLPVEKLNQVAISFLKKAKDPGITYEFPPGNSNLRRQIAKFSTKWGGDDETLIITTGATEGIILSLKAIAKSGDAVIVASPGYFGIMQIIETLGMQVLEIPNHSKFGLDVEFMQKALSKNNVGAAILCPTISNPQCSIMPDENKKEIYKILSARNIPIIEDDVYSELYFGEGRPKPIKAFDNYGSVIYVSSFSKTIAPGYRVGWISPGRYYEKIKRLKFASTLASPSITQQIMAEFLRSGGYEKSIQSLRKIYEKQTKEYTDKIIEYFPYGTKVSKPQGGYYLWVELPENINSIELQKKALRKKISITPGPLFSTRKENVINYIRLNCGFPLINKIDSSLKELGDLSRS